MRKIKNLKTGEVFDGEFWIARIEDGVRKLEVELVTPEDADNYEMWDEEELPFAEVAEAGFAIKLDYGGQQIQHKTDHIKVADRDYYEILPDGTKKTAFTWDEAMEIEKKTHDKWRVPTQAEWFAIVAAFGRDEDEKITGETLAKNLNLTTDEGGDGYFWSSSVDGTTGARNLYFGSTAVNPQYSSDKVYGFTVRCVAGKGE